LSVRTHVAKSIGDVQVVELRIWIPLSDRGGLVIITDVEKSEVERNGSSISLIGAGVKRPALDSEIGLQSGNVHLLNVCPRIDEKDLGCSCAWRKGIDTFLNGGK
jgi:hypothetical protein